MKNKNPGDAFFQSTWNIRSIKPIVFYAILFHVFLVVVLFVFNSIKFKKEPELIPVFELVQIKQEQIAPEKTAPELPKEIEKQKPEMEQKPKQIEKKVVENKPKEIPKEPVLNKETEKIPEESVQNTEEETASEIPENPEIADAEAEDFDIDDMELPEAAEKSSLLPVGMTSMDPLLQAFLERLKILVMQNFNPPNGIQIPRNAKTVVQFTVYSNGKIADVSLKQSSGNKTWDALSLRAVQITTSPNLPATYSSEALSLQFNFTPD